MSGHHAIPAITVADTGIPEDRQARIFDAFVQADGSTGSRSKPSVISAV